MTDKLLSETTTTRGGVRPLDHPDRHGDTQTQAADYTKPVTTSEALSQRVHTLLEQWNVSTREVLIDPLLRSDEQVCQALQELGIADQAVFQGAGPVSPEEVYQKWLVSETDTLVALTSVTGYIQETGTLILTDPLQQALSLVARYHLYVIYPEQIWQNLEQWTEHLAGLLAGQQRMSLEQVVFATGPSQTADIEKTLVRGAQGPAEVIPIFVGWRCPETFRELFAPFLRY